MSAVQEEPEVEVVDQDAVEFVDVTTKKAAATMVDQIRFDILVDVGKYDESKLDKDIRDNIIAVSGDRNWYVSVDYPDSLEVTDHAYGKYAKEAIETRCIVVWKPGGAELTSPTTLMVREACLAGIARQPKQSVWTNGMGDMAVDIGIDDVQWEDIGLHNSVVIDTGSTLDIGSAKKITYLRFTVSMPDNSGVTDWGSVERYIRDQLNKINWKKHDTNYSHSGRFDGNMYRWYITLQFGGDKPKPTPEVITPVWEACLTGVHKYRLDKEDSVIIQHMGTASMEIGDQKWDVMTPPPILYVGE